MTGSGTGLEGEAIPIIREAMDRIDPNLQLDVSIVDVTLNNDELVRAVSHGLRAIRFLVAPHTHADSMALYEISTKAFSESIAEEIMRVQARQTTVPAETMVANAFARVKQALIARSDAVVNTEIKYNKFSDGISNLEVQRELYSSGRRVPRSVDLLRSRLETPRSSVNERQLRKEIGFNSAGETFHVLRKQSHTINRPSSGSSFRRGEQHLADASGLHLASSSAHSLLGRLRSLDQD